jgi:hypothetical protein
MNFQEQEDFVRNIKGAPASILWILLLSGRSLDGKELQRATGYSDKPISDALAWLEPRGYVQFNGRQNGWSLGAGIRQLPLPFAALEDGTDDLLDTGDRNISDLAVLGPEEDRNISDLAPAETIPVPVPATNGTAVSVEEDRNISDLAVPRPEEDRKYSDLNGQESPEDRNISDLAVLGPGEDRKYSDLAPPIVVVVDQQTNKESLKQQQQQHNGADRKNSDLAALMRRIGIRGKAFVRYLQRQIDPAEMLALWWDAQMQPWVQNPAGHVITNLDNRLAAPDGLVRLAHLWPGMDQAERGFLVDAATGQGEDRHAPARDAEELRYWLPEDFRLDLDDAVLESYLALQKKAPHELEVA